MKTIDTLVEDIQRLFNEDEHHTDEQRTRVFGQRVGDTIAYRLREAGRGGTLRFSNLGTNCERQLWYKVNQPERGEPLPPEARLKFLFGDILELKLLFLAEEAGHTVEYIQHELEINGVKGHIDAVIDGVLIDCKSASSISFNKFASGKLIENDPFGYIDQINAYHFAALASNLPVDPDRMGFLVIDKTLGKICLDMHKPNGVDYYKRIEEKKDVVASAELPKRAYFDEPDGKSGNRKLGTNCGYCDFKFLCWPNVRTFLYAKGPTYLTNVAKLPDVPEVER